jgi:hypothetical protein
VSEVPCVRIELLDGTTTWITVCPVYSRDHHGAIRAACEAAAMFIANLQREADIVDAHLSAGPGAARYLSPTSKGPV